MGELITFPRTVALLDGVVQDLRLLQEDLNRLAGDRQVDSTPLNRAIANVDKARAYVQSIAGEVADSVNAMEDRLNELNRRPFHPTRLDERD